MRDRGGRQHGLSRLTGMLLGNGSHVAYSFTDPQALGSSPSTWGHRVHDQENPNNTRLKREEGGRAPRRALRAAPRVEPGFRAIFTAPGARLGTCPHPVAQSSPDHWSGRWRPPPPPLYHCPVVWTGAAPQLPTSGMAGAPRCRGGAQVLDAAPSSSSRRSQVCGHTGSLRSPDRTQPSVLNLAHVPQSPLLGPTTLRRKRLLSVLGGTPPSRPGSATPGTPCAAREGPQKPPGSAANTWMHSPARRWPVA